MDSLPSRHSAYPYGGVYSGRVGPGSSSAQNSQSSGMSSSDATSRDLGNRSVDPSWASAVDPKSGSIYYYNRKTREVSWTPPSLLQKKEKAAGTTTLSEDNSIERPRREAPLRPGTERSSTSTSSAAASSLSSPVRSNYENIKEAVDVRTGMKYYYDRSTRETFWVDPRLAENFRASQKQAAIASPLLEASSVRHPPSPVDDHGVNAIVEDSPMQERVPVEEERRRYDEQEYEEEGEEYTTSDDDDDQQVSIVEVQSSLTLLKRRMKLRAAAAKVPVANNAPSMSSPVPSVENMSASFAAPLAAHSSPPRPSSAPLSSKAIPNTMICQRRSGCPCASCTRAAQGNFSAVSGPTMAGLMPCCHCGRKFNAQALERHVKICAKVFSKEKGKKTKKVAAVAAAAAATSDSTPKTSWRRRSNQLRQAMRAGRASKSDQNSPSNTGNYHVPEHDDANEDLVPCPHCNRTFAPHVAERHIPKCKHIKAKPRKLARRSGHMAVSRASKKHPVRDENRDSPNAPGKRTQRSHKTSPELAPAVNRTSVAKSGVYRRRCEHCGREFGKKAFARHQEHCAKVAKEKSLRKFDTLTKARMNRTPPRVKRGRRDGRHGEIYSRLRDRVGHLSLVSRDGRSPKAAGRHSSRRGPDLHQSTRSNDFIDGYKGRASMDELDQFVDGPFEYNPAQHSLRTNVDLPASDVDLYDLDAY